MKFTRFTRPGFLRQVGRRWLGQLWARFESDLAARGLALPAPGLDDENYYDALAELARTAQGLPENLTETLYAIDEMSDPKGQEALERAIGQAQLDLRFEEESSRGDIAVQVWLARPELLAAKHHERRVKRLAKFEYYSPSRPTDRRRSFTALGQDVLEKITADLDWWFHQHSRGHQTTRLETFPVEDGLAFMVRHGDTLTRRETIDNGRLSMVHFRPLKDDVVVYAPERDEMGIHAGTKGERDLYRMSFGHRLLGDPGYFSQRHGLTLEPLRTLGRDALDAERLPGVKQIVLRELELRFGHRGGETIVRRSEDLFRSQLSRSGLGELIPCDGELVRAAFDFRFEWDHHRPRKVEVRPPNLLKMGRDCPAPVIHRWLTAMSFRTPAGGPRGCSNWNADRAFFQEEVNHV